MGDVSSLNSEVPGPIHDLLPVYKMVAIGSLLFCDVCGSLLPRIVPGQNEDDMVKCDDCFQYTKDTSSKVITSTSKPSAFPSATIKTLRSAKYQRRRLTSGSCNSTRMSRVPPARDVLSYKTVTKRRRRYYRLLQM